MSDNSFLKHFITEPIYIIADGNEVESSTAISTIKEEVVANSAEPASTPVPTKEAESEKPLIEVNEILPQADQKRLKYKGKNEKSILIIVDQPKEEYINQADELFLIKILGALKLTLNDVAIANFTKNPNLTRGTLDAFEADKYLIFGVMDEKLFNNDLPKYQIINLGNNKQTLHCSSLGAIASDLDQKKLLWTALQKMFAE